MGNNPETRIRGTITYELMAILNGEILELNLMVEDEKIKKMFDLKIKHRDLPREIKRRFKGGDEGSL